MCMPLEVRGPIVCKPPISCHPPKHFPVVRFQDRQTMTTQTQIVCKSKDHLFSSISRMQGVSPFRNGDTQWSHRPSFYLQGYGCSQGFCGLIVINYTWLKLGGGAASTAPDWLPVRGSFSWNWLVWNFSSSGKQKLRPSLPNCQFAACHGVSLSLVKSVLLSYGTGDYHPRDGITHSEWGPLLSITN